MSSSTTELQASTNSTTSVAHGIKPKSMAKTIPPHMRSAEEHAALRNNIATARANDDKPPSEIQQRIQQNYARQKTAPFRPIFTKTAASAVGCKKSDKGAVSNKNGVSNKSGRADKNATNLMSSLNTKQTGVTPEKSAPQVPKGKEALTKQWNNVATTLREQSEYEKSTQGYN